MTTITSPKLTHRPMTQPPSQGAICQQSSLYHHRSNRPTSVRISPHPFLLRPESETPIIESLTCTSRRDLINLQITGARGVREVLDRRFDRWCSRSPTPNSHPRMVRDCAGFCASTLQTCISTSVEVQQNIQNRRSALVI